jgi:hypothetical protein
LPTLKRCGGSIFLQLALDFARSGEHEQNNSRGMELWLNVFLFV